MNRLKKWIKSLIKIMQVPEMKILPGHIAFFLVLAIVPLITLVGLIANHFSISMESLIDISSHIIPEDISKLLLPFVKHRNNSNTVIFMIIGFVLASNGPHAIITACDILYGEKPSDYLSSRIKSFVLTIILTFLFFFSLVVLAFGNSILNFILHLKLLDTISAQTYWLFFFIKYPFAFILIYWMIKMLYTLAPTKKIPSSSVTKGAVFTTISWLLVTYGYSIYITHFSNYDLFYGSLSSIIMMMFWVYILSIILVIGIAINRNVYYRYEKDNKK